VEWVHHTTRQGVLDMVSSRSYVATGSALDRERVLDQVARLLDRYPAPSGRDTIELPYVTQCSRTCVTRTPPPGAARRVLPTP
jgi:hypothetical protein